MEYILKYHISEKDEIITRYDSSIPRISEIIILNNKKYKIYKMEREYNKLPFFTLPDLNIYLEEE